MFILVYLLFAAPLSKAQGVESDKEAQRGTTEEVTSRADPAQRYALFLPRGYEPDRTAPVMILMDPRRRALLPLHLFRDAADQYGFVLMSSYNTLSDADSAFAANDRALSAMLVDAQSRFKVDPRRLYLVGFSGTAHYAWNVAPRLDGKLAGIMGVGGGLPAFSDPIQRALKAIYPFAFFGAAGMADFNFDGVRYLDLSLDSTRFAHRFMTHDGDHEWPPKSIAESAVEWFHLRAMGAGLTPRDNEFVEAARRRHLEEAAAYEASGHKTDAYRRYREIVQDFEPLGGAPEARKRFEALSGDRSVSREMSRREKYLNEVIEYKLDVREFYLEYRDKHDLPSLETSVRELKIDKLKKRALRDDREDAFAAKRMLATAFVNTGFYEPRDYFEKRDYRRAAGMLRIADSIRPDVPRVCYQLARAAAQLGEVEEALRALECGLAAEWATRQLVERDTLLRPLQMDSGYRALVQQMPPGR